MDRTENSGQLFPVVPQIAVGPKFCMYELRTSQIYKGKEGMLNVAIFGSHKWQVFDQMSEYQLLKTKQRKELL